HCARGAKMHVDHRVQGRLRCHRVPVRDFGLCLDRRANSLCVPWKLDRAILHWCGYARAAGTGCRHVSRRTVSLRWPVLSRAGPRSVSQNRLLPVYRFAAAAFRAAVGSTLGLAAWTWAEPLDRWRFRGRGAALSRVGHLLVRPMADASRPLSVLGLAFY